jgi:hypothetical protein
MPKVNSAVLSMKVELLEKVLQEKTDLIDKLLAQLESTQKALVAKESPEAYREQVTRELEAAITPAQRQAMEEESKKNKLVNQFTTEIEREHYFEDPDELLSLFTGTLMKGTEPGSVHGNEES